MRAGKHIPLYSILFQVSMTYYREKYLEPTFLVVSDDTAWCKEHLTADDVRIIGKISATMALSYIIYP